MKGSNYEAFLDLEFSAIHTKTDLFIDFNNKAVKSLTINKNTIQNINWDGLFLKFPRYFL